MVKQFVEQLWGDYDKDGSGFLDKAECKALDSAMLKEMGTDPKEMSDADYDETFARYDTNGNGKISKAEYAVFVKSLLGLWELPPEIKKVLLVIWACAQLDVSFKKIKNKS